MPTPKFTKVADWLRISTVASEWAKETRQPADAIEQAILQWFYEYLMETERHERPGAFDDNVLSDIEALAEVPLPDPGSFIHNLWPAPGLQDGSCGRSGAVCVNLSGLCDGHVWPWPRR